MSEIIFANYADGVIDFTNSSNTRKTRQPHLNPCTICSNELEELIATIRVFIQHAQTSGDVFEYYRLCEELRLAEAARSGAISGEFAHLALF